MADITRREFVHVASAASLLATATRSACRPTGRRQRLHRVQHVPVPLPFDAKSLKGDL